MLTRFNVIVSDTGSIKDIRAYGNYGGGASFEVVDSLGNIVRMSENVAFLGLEIIAIASGLTRSQYLDKLAAYVDFVKGDSPTELKEKSTEEKKEEPNVASVQE
jgi:hypothetical protein